jgi:outer membrane protein assembly factor BamB
MTRYLKKLDRELLKRMLFRSFRPLAIKIVLFLVMVALLAAGGCINLGAQQAGWSGVTVADGSLYFGSTGGNLIKVDAENGDTLWQVAFKASGSAGLGCSAPETAVALYSTPAVAGELVYIAGYNGKIYALNTEAGASRWVYPREGNLYSFVGGMVIDQDRLYIGSLGGIIYALDAENGDLTWQFDTGDEIWSTPAVSGDTLYIGSFNKKVYAIDTATGEEKWPQPFETQGPVVSTPLVCDNTVYISSFDRHIYALDAATGEQIWQFPAAEANGEGMPQKWFWAAPVMHDGIIYATNMDGRVYAINAEDGSLITVIDLGSAVSSTPVVAGDKIYIATEDGDLFYIDTADNSKTELPLLGGEVTAPLATSDGVVYIHSNKDEIIYALSAETGEIVWNTPVISQ